jgi:hypothetical protein
MDLHVRDNKTNAASIAALEPGFAAVIAGVLRLWLNGMESVSL